MIVFAGLFSAIMITGLLLVVRGLRRQPWPAAPAAGPATRVRARVTATLADDQARRRRAGQLIAALLAGMLAWVVTGWPDRKSVV